MTIKNTDRQDLINLLLELWNSRPEERFLQMVSNLLYKNNIDVRVQDIFFILDEELIEILKMELK